MPGEREEPAVAPPVDGLSDLQEILRLLAGWLKRNDSLAKKLRLDEPFEGFLAEALVAVALEHRLGAEIRDMRWARRRPATYDLELTLKNGRTARVVVKTIRDEGFHPLSLVGPEDWQPVRRVTAHGEDLSFRLPATASAELERQIDKVVPAKGLFYWVLVSPWDDPPGFYVLNKRDFKACLLQDYHEQRGRKSHELEYDVGLREEDDSPVVPRQGGWKAILASCRGGFEKIVED